MWRLTDEQRELREQIRAFVHREVRPRMLEVDETCDYPFEVHRALSEEGLIGLAVPEASLELLLDWLARRAPIAAGRAHGGVTARAEPVTRALGLPIGALRTGASLLAAGAGRVRPKDDQGEGPTGGGAHVEADRRAA